MNATYDAASIEVLAGLDPVRKRPGMYTDTARPNHLAQEVIDNSVDEAIVGQASRLAVVAHPDDSLTVGDDGRGMPVDIHPEEGIPGVELILTRLHAGGKFSQGSYRFSGGLHGVGVSVVNALSRRLEVRVKRDGSEYAMAFEGGEKVEELEVVGSVGRRNTGTTIRFWPDGRYFDSPKFSIPRLLHTLRAKAVLCPGLHVSFEDEATGERSEWHYEDGLSAYLARCTGRGRRHSGISVRRKHGGQHRGGGLGGGVAAGRWGGTRRELRQSDPHHARRHPRQRLPGRAAGGPARVLRVPQPAPARGEARTRGRLGPLPVRAVGEDERAAVHRADQGPALLPGSARRSSPGS